MVRVRLTVRQGQDVVVQRLEGGNRGPLWPIGPLSLRRGQRERSQHQSPQGTAAGHGRGQSVLWQRSGQVTLNGLAGWRPPLSSQAVTLTGLGRSRSPSLGQSTSQIGTSDAVGIGRGQMMGELARGATLGMGTVAQVGQPAAEQPEVGGDDLGSSRGNGIMRALRRLGGSTSDAGPQVYVSDDVADSGGTHAGGGRSQPNAAETDQPMVYRV